MCAFQFVAAKGDVAMVQMLVDFGAEVNARDYTDVGGYSPLHYAVQMNNYEVSTPRPSGCLCYVYI